MVRLQELEDQELAQLALRGLGLVLGLGAVAPQLDELGLVEHAVVAGQPSAQRPALAAPGHAAAVVGGVEVRLEGAVHGQVRVAPDGAGEMRVVLGGQGEVADQGRTVGGRGQRAQDRKVNRAGGGPIAAGVEESLQVAAVRLVGQAQPQPAGVHAKLLDVARDRVGVDAPQDGQSRHVEGAGDRLVCLDHEHLDDRVGEGVVLRDGVHHAAVVVEDQLHLRQVQDDHAVAKAPLAEDPGQAIAAAQRLDQLVGVLRLRPRVPAGGFQVAVDEGLGLQVGQPLVGPDHRRRHALVEDAAAGSEGHEDRLGEPGHAFLEGADAVGERLGEHRDHQPRQVDAVAAEPGLLVERRLAPHEVADVGDVHAEDPLVLLLVAGQGDRVVEVPRVGRVDGDREGSGEVLAVAGVRGLEGPGRRRGFLHDGAGELGAQAMGDDHRFRLDVGLAGLAQDAGDHALGHVVLVGIMEQLDHHLVARLGSLGVGIPDEDRLAERLTPGIDQPAPAALEEHAHEVLATALQDLDDLAHVGTAAGLGLAPPGLLAHPRPDAVAGDRVAGAALGDEEVALAQRVVRDHEAEPAGVEAKLALDLVAVGRQAGPAFVAHLQAAGLGEQVHRLLEDPAVLRLDGEIADQLAQGRWPVPGVGQVLEDAVGETEGHGRPEASTVRKGRRAWKARQTRPVARGGLCRIWRLGVQCPGSVAQLHVGSSRDAARAGSDPNTDHLEQSRNEQAERTASGAGTGGGHGHARGGGPRRRRP